MEGLSKDWRVVVGFIYGSRRWSRLSDSEAIRQVASGEEKTQVPGLTSDKQDWEYLG